MMGKKISGLSRKSYKKSQFSKKNNRALEEPEILPELRSEENL